MLALANQYNWESSQKDARKKTHFTQQRGVDSVRLSSPLITSTRLLYYSNVPWDYSLIEANNLHSQFLFKSWCLFFFKKFTIKPFFTPGGAFARQIRHQYCLSNILYITVILGININYSNLHRGNKIIAAPNRTSA